MRTLVSRGARHDTAVDATDPSGMTVTTHVGTGSIMIEIAAPQIRSIRARLGLSQELFSRVLDVS
jgi:DNA-binding transcriptional regulator YiaG